MLIWHVKKKSNIIELKDYIYSFKFDKIIYQNFKFYKTINIIFRPENMEINYFKMSFK